MSTTDRLRRPALILGVAAMLAGCSGAMSTTPASTPVPAKAAPTQATVTAPAPEAMPVSSDAWLVVGRPGDDRLHVILASTEEEMASLPLGAPDKDWANIVVTRGGDGATTRVEDLRAERGFKAWGDRLEIAGAWRLPTIGLDPVPVGVSADGSTVVLVEPDPTAKPGTSRFAVFPRTLDTQPRIVELAGAFEFDALSPDGSLLYVVEHLPGPPAGHYQVRIVETATGTLRPDVIVDKLNVNETMAGWPVAQTRRSDGLVLTLYRAAGHPFIHALNSIESWAICLDLPATGADDADAALDWGLATTLGGDLVAINSTLGLAVEVDPSDFAVRRSVRFEPSAAHGIALAKFGHQPTGPVGRRVVATADGSSFYAAGPGGIVRLDPKTLGVTSRFVEGSAVESMAVTPDGGTIYALMAPGGRIMKLDAESGKVLGEVPSSGYDRLVAIVPY
jgi:hypothetical protein